MRLPARAFPNCWSIKQDEGQATLGSRILFITPTLKGVLDDFSYPNPNRSNRVLERFARIVEVPQVRFYTAIDLLSGDDNQFGYQKRAQTYQKTADVALVSGKTYSRARAPALVRPPATCQRLRRGSSPADSAMAMQGEPPLALATEWLI